MGVDIKKKQIAATTVTKGDTTTSNIVGTAEVHHPDGSSVEEKEEVGTAVLGKGPFANVGVRAGRTIKTGEYENARIEVSLFAPAEMTEEDIDDTFKFCYEWVETKMTEVLDKLNGG